MNNLNHANDKSRAPSYVFTDDTKQFRSELHYLKNILKKIELAYEGFCCSRNYTNDQMPESLQDEGNFQKQFYAQQFSESWSELNEISQEILNYVGMKVEGK